MNAQRKTRRRIHGVLSLLCLAVVLGSTAFDEALAAGTVSAWGDDDSAQCDVPARATNAVAVAGGGAHSLALKEDGTVLAWGFNSFGQATVPANLSDVMAIAANASYSLAVQTNGAVVGWGGVPTGGPALTNVAAIAAGWSHVLALLSDGTLLAWGTETNVPGGISNVVAIAAGTGQSLALQLDGTVVAWGDNDYNKATVPAGLSNVIAIAAGQDHCLALKRDGTVVAWGRDDHGQATVPASVTNAVAISAGALHSLALLADGRIAAWGYDAFGQVSSTPAEAGHVGISAGAYHNLAIGGDGRPVILESPASQSVTVSRSATFRVLATGAQPLSYQWAHAGNTISEATTSVLTLTNVQLSDGGPYMVVVTNALGLAQSSPGILTVLGDPPVVTAPPQDQTAVCGDGAMFSVAATGSAPLSYQWQFQGAPIPGATDTNLVLTNVATPQAGQYSVLITNAFGSVVTGAVLTVTVAAPSITSPLSASGAQGVPFTYAIQALHSPQAFGAFFLPGGLALNPTNGVISGVPTNNGVYAVTIIAYNACSSDSQTLVVSISPSIPVITSPVLVAGTEQAPFAYQITATGSPASFGAQNLPVGLTVDPLAGLISGAPAYPGEFDATISASNVWGTGSTNLHFSFAVAPIDNLNIGNVTYNYSAPHLLDFQFSLFTLTDPNDPTTARGVAIDPKLLSATCLEDDVPTGSETGAFVSQASQGRSKLTKIYLVLDFTESIASLANGDANTNGISDAVDFMIAGAQDFVRQQPADTQIGVFEFHREDMAPSNVVALTSDKLRVNAAIGGILTNFVRGFSAGSRCWDAVSAAITALGPKNRDETHYVVFISDGRDESSTATTNSIISAATNATVKIFAVGFGAELDAPTLQTISSSTLGGYYTATNSSDLAAQFAQVTKDFKAQYVLRWATLKVRPFMPSFQIAYQGLIATSPTNPFTIGFTNIDTSTDPPTTNSMPSTTNFIIGYFYPASNAGPVTLGSMRLAPNAEVQPTGVDLRASYVPRYIRQVRLHYRPNWPCTVSLQNDGSGEMLEGWSLSQTNDGTGGSWLLLSSPNPSDPNTGMPFAAFGRLLTFTFQDSIQATNLFSVFDIDNSIYSNILAGGQSFTNENFPSFITNYPALPHGTPVPWLRSFGYTGNYTNAELLDPDGDGMPNWKEYWANTNPTNAASVFLIRNVQRFPDGRFLVTFSTSTNRWYRLDASLDLVNWQTVQDNIPAINQDVSILDTRFLPNLTNIFYRVLVY